MIGVQKLACLTAALLLSVTLSAAPARAQFAPFGGSGSDMMTQMAPMLEMMKAKMGKRRFAAMMQTMGPMMSKMMDSGGLGGMSGIGTIPVELGGGTGLISDGSGIGTGFGIGGDMAGVLGSNGGDMIGMIPQIVQIVQIAGVSGGIGHKRHRRRF